MDKDLLKGKLQDFTVFLVCVGAILGIAYYTGFLKGFTPADFKDAYNKIVKNIPQGKRMSRISGSTSTKYNGYTPSRIPQEVLRGSQTSRAWRNVFNTGAKSIFYVYDESATDPTYSKDFHLKLQDYISRSPAKTSYNVAAYPLHVYKNLRTGVTSSYDICNSIEECKAQKQRATDYAAMSNLMLRCSKTMCVFNPQKGQYVVLKTRNFVEATRMINALKDW